MGWILKALVVIAVMIAGLGDDRQARAAAFQVDDFYTSDDAEWGSSVTTAGSILVTGFSAVYGASNGELEVGVAGTSGYSIIFTGFNPLLAFLPDNGQPGVLNFDLLDPTRSASRSFGSNVVALTLNVDFDDAGLTSDFRTGSFKFGDLIIGPDLTGLPALNPVQSLDSQFYGLTIRQFLTSANQALGGAVPYENAYYQTALLLNDSFLNGRPSETSHRQLSYPSAIPEPATWATMIVGFALLAAQLRRRANRLRSTAEFRT